MSGARAQILQAVRRGLDAAGSGRPAAEAAVAERLAARARNLVPARARLPVAAMRDLFAAKAMAANATVDRVLAADLPDALLRYLGDRNLPPSVAMSPDFALDPYPWGRAGLLEIARRRAEPADPVSVTPAFAGIAETGTLMLWSAAERPTTLNFLPETHVAVLRAGDVVPALEDAWTRLRNALGTGAAEAARPFPRTVNLITGPSRTADIEQELILGAHGPRRLHILLVEDED
ncbi:MAG: LUD domain-containing protein [Sneathiellaceae bacterium]